MVKHDEQGRILVHPLLASCNATPARKELRIATWNIAAAQHASLGDVASVIRALDADLVAIQEVDVATERSGGVDQALWLADGTGYEPVFAESIPLLGGAYGLALLTRVPVSRVESRCLPSEFSSEPRILLDVDVCAGGHELRVVNTHIDYLQDAAEDQVRGMAEVLGRDWRGVLVGDRNLRPDNDAIADLLDRTELEDLLVGRDEGPTRGRRRIDYVFASEEVADGVQTASRHPSDASDHDALVVDLVLPNK